ncbi:hypothetical protein SprV_0301147100 [Sparganum proliferum]
MELLHLMPNPLREHHQSLFHFRSHCHLNATLDPPESRIKFKFETDVDGQLSFLDVFFTVEVSSDKHIQEGQLLFLFFFIREYHIREDCVEQAVEMLQHILLYDDERVVYVTAPKHRFMLDEGNLS